MKKERIIIASILGILIVIVSILILIKPIVLTANKKETEESPSALSKELSVNKGSILLGMRVLYEGEGISYDEQNNIVSIKKGGEYEISGNFINGQIEVATQDPIKLIMAGVNIQNDSIVPLNIIDSSEVTIELLDNSDNTFYSSLGITSSSNINITGNGNLTINSTNGNGLMAASLIITSGHLTIYASQRPLVNAIIKGGEIIGFGNSETSDISSDSNQKSFQINFLKSFKEKEVISLVDANNNELVTQEVKGKFKSFLYSSPYLYEGDYTLLKDTQKINFNGKEVFNIKNQINYFQENA